MEMQENEYQKGGWTIVALLFCFMMINFADKAIVGLAAVPIMKELGLTPKQFGLINSSFFFLFSISAVVTGFIVNRIQTRWALLAMGLVWALTQFPMVGSVGFAGLITCRVILGAGEGPAYPVALHATYKWFPNSLRSLPTSVISQGAAIGVVFAIPILDHVIEEYSWRWAFGLLGAIGLVWSLVWAAFGREGKIVVTIVQESGHQLDRIPYRKLLLNKTVLAAFAAGFSAYWGLSLLIGWFTPFLIQGLGVTQREAAWITTLPWMASPLVVITASYFSQRMLAKGVSSRWARGVLSGGCVALGGLALIAMPHMATPSLKIAMVVIGMSVPAVIYVMGHAMIAEFTPVSQRGAMLAINNAVITSAGLIAPYLMGGVIEAATKSGASAADGYMHGFMICGVLSVICGLIGMVFLRPGQDAARFASFTASPQNIAIAAE
jgi:MFS family permease